MFLEIYVRVLLETCTCFRKNMYVFFQEVRSIFYHIEYHSITITLFTD